jgi:hypothetical protein
MLPLFSTHCGHCGADQTKTRTLADARAIQLICREALEKLQIFGRSLAIAPRR